MQVVECLNHSNPEIQQYIQNLGIEDTYRQYILHGYSLPDFKEFNRTRANPALRDNQLLTHLGSLLNLSEFQVRDLEEIRNMLPANTEGAFWKNVVYLSKFANGDTIHEEAFHAIFQSIISPQQKQELLKTGRYMLQAMLGDKTLKQHLSEQRLKHPELYINQTVEEQIDRLAEEHLASEFVRYAKNPSAYTHGGLEKYYGNKAQSFLDKVIKFFKRLLGLKSIHDNNQTVINAFFSNIARGKFKDARIRSRNQNDAIPFTRLINMFDGTKLSAHESGMLKQSILASTLDRIELIGDGASVDEIIPQIMAGYSEWYGDANADLRDILKPMKYDFNFDTGELGETHNPEYTAIIEDIKRLLTDVKSITEVIEDAEVQENEIAKYDAQANQQGYTAQSMWLKSYISTAGKVLNEEQAANGAVKIIQAVEPSKVYYSLLRASRNAKSDEERIRTFINFAGLGSNEQNKIFLDSKLRKDIKHKDGRTFTDTEWNALFSPSSGMSQWNEILHPKSKRLLAKMMKGFDMWVRENMELFYDVPTGSSVASNANARGVDTVQFETWQKEHNWITNDENPDRISDINVRKIINSIDENGFQDMYESMEEFNERVDVIQKGFDSIGLKFAKEYIEFSLFMVKQEQNSDSPIIKELATKYDKFRNNVGKDFIDEEFIEQLKKVTRIKDNKFAYTNGIFNTQSKTSIKPRLKAKGRGNAIFDENAMDTSYVDPEGNTIYLHQNKTFNLQFLSLFSDYNAQSIFEKLATGSNVVQRLDANGDPVTFKEDADFYRNNFMLKWLRNNEYRDTSRFDSFSVAGITPKPITGGTDEQKQYGSENAVTFSSMETRDFDLYRMNIFFTKIAKVGNQYFAPVFVGNNEAKNTAEFINMPIHNTLIGADGQLSEEGVNAIYQEVKNEYDRIQRISRQRETGFEDTFNKYNTGKVTRIQVITEGQDIREIYAPVKLSGDTLELTGDFRGLQFTNATYGMAGMGMDFRGLTATQDGDTVVLNLSEKEVEGNLLLQALLGTPIEDTKVKETIPQGIDAILKSHIQDLVDQKIVTRLSDGSLMIPSENSESLLHPDANIMFPKSLEVSLRKMFVSSMMNTMSLNQLMMGDPALSVKNDFVDFFKRNGGRNAAIVGFRNDFIDVELGITEPFQYVKSFIFSEPTANADNDDAGYAAGKPAGIDLADAQNWTSVQYFRKALWGQTKLTQFHARVLNDIESGKPIAKETMQRLLDSGVVFNSMKTVGFTGKVYHKKSDKMLTREETSYPQFLTQQQYEEAIGNTDLSKGRFGVLNGTQLPDRADYTFYDENGTRRYVKWLPKQEKRELHDLRLRLSGFSTDPDTGVLSYNSADEIDIAMPVSASKMTSVNIHPVNSGFLNVRSRNVSAMDANFYGLQTENPSGKEKIVDPTQMLEIIMSELKGTVGGINLDTLKEQWDEFSAQRDDLMFNTAYKALADQVKAGDISQFKDMILRGIVASGGDIQTQQLLNTREDVNGIKYGYNLNLPIIEGKFIQQFFAYFTKEVLSQKVAGDSKVLVSSYGHNVIKKLRREGNYITWDVINEQHPEYAAAQASLLPNLQGYRYDHKIDGENVTQETNWFEEANTLINEGQLYVIDSLRHNVPDFQNGKITGWFSEGLMPTHNLDIETIQDRYSRKFMVRIPSQDKQSGLNVKWVGMMPAYFGSSIIVPKEVVYLSGADFDVDKGYVQDVDTYTDVHGDIVPYGTATTKQDKWYEYITSIKKNKIVKDKLEALKDKSDEYLLASDDKKYGIEQKLLMQALQELDLPTFYQDGIEKYTSGVLNNRLLEIKQKALNNYLTLKEGGISKTPITLDALKDLKKEQEFPPAGKTYGSHWYGAHSNSHKQNTTGKGLIGVSVIGMLGYINALKFGVKVKGANRPQLDVTNPDIDGSYKEISKDHTGKEVRVMDLISTITSANTDEAKEQLNAYFGMTNETQAVVIQMIGLGYPLKTALMFIKQPIIQYYTGQLQKMNYALRTKAELEIEGAPISKDAIVQQVLNTLNINLTPEQKGNPNYDIMKDSKQGQSYTTQDLSNKLIKGGADMTPLQKLQVFKDFLKLTDISTDMGNFVSIVRIKKGLNPDIDGFERLRDNKKLINEDKMPTLDFGSKMRSEKNNKLARQLRNYTDVGGVIDKVTELAQQLFLQKHGAYQAVYNNVKADVRIKKNDEPKFRKVVSSFVMNELDGINDNVAVLDLLYSNPNSLAHQIQRKFDDASFKNNPLIKQLGFKFNNATEGIAIDEVTIDTISKLSSKEQETLMESFEELFIHEKHRDIAIKMFQYFKLKDGFQFGTGNLSKIFPAFMFSDISQKINNLMADKLQLEGRTEFKDSYMTHSRNKSLLGGFRYLDFRTNTALGIPVVINKSEDAVVSEYLRGEGGTIYKEFPLDQRYSFYLPMPTHGGLVTPASSKYKVYTEAEARKLIEYADKYKSVVTDNIGKVVIKAKTVKDVDITLTNATEDWQRVQDRINEYYTQQLKLAKVQVKGKLVDIENLDEAVGPVKTNEEAYGDFLGSLGLDSPSENKENEATTPQAQELARLQQQLDLATVNLESFLDTNDGIIYRYFKNGGRIKPESFDNLIDKNKRTAATNGAYTNKNGLTYDNVARHAFAISDRPMDDGQAVRELEDYITKYPNTWAQPYNDLVAERDRIQREIDYLESDVNIPQNNNPKQSGCI